METVQILRDRMFFLLGQTEEAKRIYTAALKESEANAKKQSDSKPVTVDTGDTKVFNSDAPNESQ